MEKTKLITKKSLAFVTILLFLVTTVLPIISNTVLPASGNMSPKIDYEKYSSANTIPNIQSIRPGDHFRLMFFGWRIRSYRFHIPPSYDGSNPVPLVFVLHGWPSSSKLIREETEMNEKADEEGFIVVYPNGERCTLIHRIISFFLQGKFIVFRWNFCNDINVDDVGYIRAIIEHLQTVLNINSSRIYISGKSHGAHMTYRLGAELSDILAAISPVAGSIGEITPDGEFYIIPEPEHPVSVIVFHGMKDKNVPYDGWEGGKKTYASVNESVSFWAKHNGCDPDPKIIVSESGNIITTKYSNGSKGTEVLLYTVVNGDHYWYGSSQTPPCEISVNDCMWEFFEHHPKQYTN